MASTLRTVINRVLTAIGEATVGNTVTDLTPLPLPMKVLEFINQIKEEIEDATYWRALRQTFTVSVPAYSGTFPNPPTPIVGTDERARVIRVPEPEAGQLVPLVFDITVPSAPVPLGEIPNAELVYRIMSDGNSTGSTTVQPSYYSIDMSSSDVAQLYIYPVPNTPRTVMIHMHVPETVLLPTDLDRSIQIPGLPLLKGAIWYALLDRGEEMGANAAFTEERYRTSLDDAIARDDAESGSLDQLVPDYMPWPSQSSGGSAST